MPLFWLCVFVIVLPAALRLTRRSVNHVLRPPGTPEVGGSRPALYAVCLERGARAVMIIGAALLLAQAWQVDRSEEHTSELQSLMRISYAVFCLKKKKKEQKK